MKKNGGFFIKWCTYQERNSVDEEGEEPVESDGGDVNVETTEVAVEVGQFLLHQVLQDILVHLRSTQVVVKVVHRKESFRDGHQGPAGDDQGRIYMLYCSHFTNYSSRGIRLNNCFQLLSSTNKHHDHAAILICIQI